MASPLRSVRQPVEASPADQVATTQEQLDRVLADLTIDSLCDLPIADTLYCKALLRSFAAPSVLRDALSDVACSGVAAAFARAYDGVGVAVRLRRATGRAKLLALRGRSPRLAPLHWLNALCAAQLSGHALAVSALTSSKVSGQWIRALDEHEMHWVPVFSYWTRLAMRLRTPPAAAILDDVATLCSAAGRKRWCAISVQPLVPLARAIERGDVRMVRLAAHSALLRTCSLGPLSVSLPLLAMIQYAHEQGLCPELEEMSRLLAFLAAPRSASPLIASASLALSNAVTVVGAADSAPLCPTLLEGAWRTEA